MFLEHDLCRKVFDLIKVREAGLCVVSCLPLFHGFFCSCLEGEDNTRS